MIGSMKLDLSRRKRTVDMLLAWVRKPTSVPSFKSTMSLY